MDELLNTITNRSGGFLTLAYPSISSFVPKPQDDGQAGLRTLLGLDRRDTDYFVQACLTTIQLYPDLVGLFRERERSYDLTRYRPQETQVINAQLVHDNGTAPGVLRHAAEWPVQFRMTLQRLSNESALLRMVGQDDELVSTQVLDDQMRVTWPAWSGVTGLLWRADGWADTTLVLQIDHTPVRFPYAALRTALKNSDATSQILSRTNLLDAFLNTYQDRRAVALAICALGVSNL